LLRGNFKRGEPVEHLGMSPIPEGVPHLNMLLLALIRLQIKSSGRPWKIELTPMTSTEIFGISYTGGEEKKYDISIIF
jgi:hypothetical protein